MIKTSKKRIKDCCLIDNRSKECERKSDHKSFSFPRKFTKEECLKGPIKGFTMRASCAPFLECSSRGKKSLKRKHKSKNRQSKKSKK